MTLTSFGQPAPPPADAVPPAPPADAVPPAPPADVPPPADSPRTAGVGFTRQLWEAIRGADIHGNDALDALAQPPQAS
ncbi:hypothetical protein A5706_18700 [Mycobacterium sp. E796]|nr:hypothetical protein A5706_18700 [Mycobacterium sp. E796]